ncbi:polyprenyl synthetase family protein [Halomonas korlensis]|uniref:Geranylgeranyl diphosphate synthase, type II n=1 Tax=Halomonas korlensis TaxID=463301 RepID=A0A1I7IY50_9GAMM|nr:polyprenyl synthetase family protein [Halomonas korlensis]SFU77824.1 geranylgeranyl diphosphate synthase, type II [Halomonas korlensis]
MDFPLPRIEGVVHDPGEYIEIRELIGTRLAALLPPADSEQDRVGLAMRTSLLSGGKRIRPTLLVLAGRGLGNNSPALLDLGCAVEMVHGASLILDDLPCMDDALLRRGQPTIHRQFGEDVAMLAAVALLTDAFRLVASIPGVPAEARVQLIARLAEASGMQGLVKGQYRDLHDNAHLCSAHAALTTNELKTGALFEAAMAMAAIASEAGAFATASLSRFAQALGQAFQLHDDLTDDHGGYGKDAGQDRGRTTLVALLGTEAVRCRLGVHLEEAEGHLAQIFGPDQSIRRYVHVLFTQLARNL